MTVQRHAVTSLILDPTLATNHLAGSNSPFQLRHRLRISPGKELWECDCTIDSRRYVAKRLLATATDLQREYFEREAIIASLVGGRGFPTLVSTALSLEQPYLVYPYIEGLKTWGQSDLQQEDLPTPLKYWLLRQICEAFSALHGQGFVHGNLRPEHILIDAGFRVRIVGLGSCLPTGIPSRQRREFSAFDAPETKGKFEACGSQDIYSIGVLSRQLLQEADDNSQLALAEPEQRPSARALAIAWKKAEMDLLGSLVKAA